MSKGSGGVVSLEIRLLQSSTDCESDFLGTTSMTRFLTLTASLVPLPSWRYTERLVGVRVTCPSFCNFKTILKIIASLEFKPPGDPPAKEMLVLLSDGEGLVGQRENLEPAVLISSKEADSAP